LQAGLDSQELTILYKGRKRHYDFKTLQVTETLR